MSELHAGAANEFSRHHSNTADASRANAVLLDQIYHPSLGTRYPTQSKIIEEPTLHIVLVRFKSFHETAANRDLEIFPQT